MNWLRQAHPFDVIRSLDKRYREFKYVGWVYIMRNRALRQQLFKIGLSRRPPDARAQELGAATAIPVDFDLVYFVHVSDRHGAESFVHSALAAHRVSPRKEFFSAPLTAAVEALDSAAERFPIILGRGGNAYVLPQLFEARTVECSVCRTKNRFKPLAIEVKARCRQCGRSLPL